jgi:hypothetical protein
MVRIKTILLLVLLLSACVIADDVRLPRPRVDRNIWGALINQFLRVSHNENGTLKTSAENDPCFAAFPISSLTVKEVAQLANINDVNISNIQWNYLGDLSYTPQAQGDVLDDLNTLGVAASDGQFVVATGAGVFAYENGNTARTSLGLGTGDSVVFAGITATSGGGITGSFDGLKCNNLYIVEVAPTDYYVQLQVPNFDLTANRKLSLIMGDTDRILTFAGDVTLEQSTTSGSAPTYTADNFSDGGSNAIITTTQETNFGTAYTHSQDNAQAHSDYLINNGSDSTSGNITMNDLIIGDARYMGSASDPDSVQIEADGDVVLTQDLAVTGTLAAAATVLTGPDYPVLSIIRDSTNEGSLLAAATLKRIADGFTPADRTGIAFFFQTDDDTGASEFAGMFGGALNDVSHGAEKGEIIFAPSWLGANPVARRRPACSYVLIGGWTNKGGVPEQRLHVEGLEGETFILVHDARSTTGDLAGIKFSTIVNGFDSIAKSFIAHIETGAWGLGDLVFCVDSAADNAEVVIGDEKMRLQSDGTLLVGSKVSFTQTDDNEYIDSLADGYMDYGATTAHRFNNDVDVSGQAGIGITPVPPAQLTAQAPDAQDTIYVAVYGITYSDDTGSGNAGVQGSAVGGGGTDNIGVFATAANASNNYHFKDAAGNYSTSAGGGSWVDASCTMAEKETAIELSEQEVGEIITTVQSLQPYKMTAKNDPNKKEFIGFALDEGMPETCLDRNHEGKITGYMVGKLGMHNLVIIQTLIEEIEELKARIDVLEKTR